MAIAYRLSLKRPETKKSGKASWLKTYYLLPITLLPSIYSLAGLVSGNAKNSSRVIGFDGVDNHSVVYR